MGKINQKIEDVQTLIQTGNSYVDSMINTKITLARSEKVDVKCTILSKMEELMIWNFALCLEISWIMRLKQSGKLQRRKKL